jgi:hypothetical protein
MTWVSQAGSNTFSIVKACSSTRFSSVHRDPCSSIQLSFVQSYYLHDNQPGVCRDGAQFTRVADDAVGVEFTSFASRWCSQLSWKFRMKLGVTTRFRVCCSHDPLKLSLSVVNDGRSDSKPPGYAAHLWLVWSLDQCMPFPCSLTYIFWSDCAVRICIRSWGS